METLRGWPRKPGEVSSKGKNMLSSPYLTPHPKGLKFKKKKKSRVIALVFFPTLPLFSHSLTQKP